MVVFSGLFTPTVKMPTLPTMVCTVFTSRWRRRYASSFPVVAFVPSSVDPVCMLTLIVMVPLSLCGAKLNVIFGMTRTTITTRTPTVARRTTALRSRSRTRDFA